MLRKKLSIYLLTCNGDLGHCYFTDANENTILVSFLKTLKGTIEVYFHEEENISLSFEDKDYISLVIPEIIHFFSYTKELFFLQEYGEFDMLQDLKIQELQLQLAVQETILNYLGIWENTLPDIVMNAICSMVSGSPVLILRG